MSAAVGALAAMATLVLAAGWRRATELGPGRPRSRAAVGARLVPWWSLGAGALASWRVGWPVGPVVVGAVVVGRRRVAAGRRRRERAAVAAAVPELVDLLRLASAAGLPVGGVLGAVAERSPPALRAGVREAERCRRLGLPLAAALGQLGAVLGPEGEEVVATLEQSSRTGVPLGPLLDELARRHRAARRARSRAAAGRLTVHLLFPLVLCTLPAAIALAVVPVLVVSLGELRP